MFGKKSASLDVKVHSNPLRVLYDGWALAFAPGSPAAVHLLELLAAQPPGIAACLALPQPDLHLDLERVESVVDVLPNTPRGWLRWEQSALPALARHHSADLLHTTSPNLPLFSSVPCLISPVSVEIGRAVAYGLANRLRAALGRGGLYRAAAVLWPNDLPPLSASLPEIRLPPIVHEAFSHPQVPPAHLPESYLIAEGPPDEAGAVFLAATWSWISRGLGSDWSLLVIDGSPAVMDHLERLCRETGILGPVMAVSPIDEQERAAIVQRAGVVLHGGSVPPWGSLAWQAFASDVPLVGVETPQLDARVGPAGYLVPPGDARALGAAAITLIVDEVAAENIRQAAQQRAAGWDRESFRQQLGAVYQQAAQRTR